MSRQQRDLRLDLDHSAGVQSEPVSLPHRGKDNRRFYRGKIGPYANALSAAERIVGKLREASCEPVPPALGMERLGIRKMLGVSVVHPLAHKNGKPSLHAVSAKFQVQRGLSAD